MDLEGSFPVTVEGEDATLRLDQWLSRRFPEVSRARWARLIEEGVFSIEGRVLGVANKLRVGQVIEFTPPKTVAKADSLSEPEPFIGNEPTVVYEDASLLVIDKPVNVAVHPGSGVPLRETLVSWLLNTKRVQVSSSAASDEVLMWGSQELEEMRPGIVHRLDRGTSGLLVVAKNPVVHAKLAKQFSDRTAGRIYHAVVPGTVTDLSVKRPQRVDHLLQRDPAPLALRIEEGKRYSFVSFLERDPANRLRFKVSPDGSGKKAITHFWEVARSSKFSLVELKLETGRTHQIRVHLNFLGYPILGDSLYNGQGFERIMLHARQLEFIHPVTNKLVQFESPWPRSTLAWLQENNLLPGAAEPSTEFQSQSSAAPAKKPNF